MDTEGDNMGSMSDAVTEIDAVKRPDGTIRVRLMVTQSDNTILALYFDAAEAGNLLSDLEAAVHTAAGHRPIRNRPRGTHDVRR